MLMSSTSLRWPTALRRQVWTWTIWTERKDTGHGHRMVKASWKIFCLHKSSNDAPTLRAFQSRRQLCTRYD